MQRIGDDTTGFTVEVPSPGTVRVTGWGFWSIDVALAFANAVSDSVRTQPRGVKLSIDMSKLKPMREQGQQAFAALMRALKELGVGQTQVVTANPLTKLQLVRLATESAPAARIEWTDEAMSLGRGQ
jgi:hypothetical protein